MAFAPHNENEDETVVPGSAPAPNPGGRNSNRTFLIAAGALGGVALLALVCMAVYAMAFVPRNKGQAQSLSATRSVQNTQMAMIITQTSVVAAYTATPTATQEPTATATPTSVVLLPTETPAAEMQLSAARTATVGALLTQAAQLTQTVFPTQTLNPRATELPSTGFADEVGLPGMLGMAVLLAGVFFLARQLRAVNE
jgi:LPXTG-motif cell wall-anchored protein